jgi:cytochrome o ubiquinol oxidase subunit IV
MDFCIYDSLFTWGSHMKKSEHINNLSHVFGVGKKSLGSYTIGFMLCIVLTLIPFYSVIHSIFSKKILLIILFLSALLQFFVQTLYFLRLNVSSEHAKMNVLVFIFTGIVAFIIIGGSIWIMTNLNYFMMH